MIVPLSEVAFAVEGDLVERGLERQLLPKGPYCSFLMIQRYTRGLWPGPGVSRQLAVRREIVRVPTYTAVTHAARRLRARWGTSAHVSPRSGCNGAWSLKQLRRGRSS